MTIEKYSFEFENNIKKNPEWRTKFAKLCNEIGIDPLISFFKSQKRCFPAIFQFQPRFRHKNTKTV